MANSFIDKNKRGVAPIYKFKLRIACLDCVANAKAIVLLFDYEKNGFQQRVRIEPYEPRLTSKNKKIGSEYNKQNAGKKT